MLCYVNIRLREQHFYLGYRYAFGATKLLMLVAQRATNHSRNLTSPVYYTVLLL